MKVSFCSEASAELDAVPPAERIAILRAIEKLQVFGDRLPFPHSSAVKGIKGATLRELRPRGGRSPWRAFYRRVGDKLIIGAIGPEATVNPSGFKRAIEQAGRRIAASEAKEPATP